MGTLLIPFSAAVDRRLTWHPGHTLLPRLFIREAIPSGSASRKWDTYPSFNNLKGCVQERSKVAAVIRLSYCTSWFDCDQMAFPPS